MKKPKISGNMQKSVFTSKDVLAPGEHIAMKVIDKLKSKYGKEEILIGVFNNKSTLMIRRDNDVLGILPFDLEETEKVINALQKSADEIRKNLQ